MILHPGIIGLIVGSSIVLLMVSHACVIGSIIIKKWDYSSSTEYQLGLERKTYLVSTLVNWALGFQVISTILFVYTMDDIHELFVGAMCATGSLNANPIGWYALLVKIVVLFLSAFWIAFNSVDQRLEDYPFIRLKYTLLIILLPLLAADLFLQMAYFMGLEPAIITSCCGSLFGDNSATAIASISALPVLPAMIAFYTVSFIFIAVSVWGLFIGNALLRYCQSAIALIFFVISVLSIISFVSIYIYELPTHHCPFDILQGWYDFIGYPIYITLFVSTYFGFLPGLLQPLKHNPGAMTVISKLERRWNYWCITSCISFVTLVIYAVLSSNLDYLGG